MSLPPSEIVATPTCVCGGQTTGTVNRFGPLGHFGSAFGSPATPGGMCTTMSRGSPSGASSTVAAPTGERVNHIVALTSG